MSCCCTGESNMSAKPYTLLVIFEAKSGKAQALKEALTALIEPTLKEEGCINYDLHQCLDNPAKFMFYENWASKEAHAKHVTSEHIQTWRTKKDELLAKPAEGAAWQLIK